MKKIRILLSVVAFVAAMTTAFAVRTNVLASAWYSQNPSTGAPLVQLPSEPPCITGTPFCAARFEVVNGQPVQPPIAGSQRYGIIAN